LPVERPEQVRAGRLADREFDRLVVMSFERRKALAVLEQTRVSPDRVFWI